jgi:hypothetical protein
MGGSFLASERGEVNTAAQRPLREGIGAGDLTAVELRLNADARRARPRVASTYNLPSTDFTAYASLGEMIEFGVTGEPFIKPRMKQTEDYITGRFG